MIQQENVPSWCLTRTTRVRKICRLLYQKVGAVGKHLASGSRNISTICYCHSLLLMWYENRHNELKSVMSPLWIVLKFSFCITFLNIFWLHSKRKQNFALMKFLVFFAVIPWWAPHFWFGILEAVERKNIAQTYMSVVVESLKSLNSALKISLFIFFFSVLFPASIFRP